MVFDFSFILVVATLLTGIIWGVYAWLIKPKRVEVAGGVAEAVREPIVVEYARSFFPVILVVLLIRSFLFEPFRIPSDSMMPTLLDGDFIFVNKFAYGLRLPVANVKIVPIGTPKRGDVIVFRLPSDPSTNYIKRLVGLPGDHILVKGRRLYINGQEMQVKITGIYEGHRHTGASLGTEDLEGVAHQVLYIPERPTRDYEQVCRPVTTSSWATTGTTAGIVVSPRSASSPRRTWSAKPCASGSTGTRRMRQSGTESAIRSGDLRLCSLPVFEPLIKGASTCDSVSGGPLCWEWRSSWASWASRCTP